jgi:hypothetical protein
MGGVKYQHIPAADPSLMQRSKKELEELGTKAAKAELERRRANKAAKRAVLKAAS